MTERKIVYVSGVTGVGKTTLCKAFAANHSGWRRISGGDMIMKATGQLSEAERDKLRETTGYKARQNQLLMLRSFRETLAETTDNIIFDGQCLVRAMDGKLRPIPASVVARMGITQVVYISAPAEVIAERRKRDAERPGREVETLEEIAYRLEKSEEICWRYAQKARVALAVLHSPRPELFARTVV